MAFTYNVTTALGQLRLEIGDTVSGAGPRPDGTNYSDEELNVLLSPIIAAGGGYGLGVARMLRRLGSEYSHDADVTIGEFSMRYAAVAENYRKQAAAWEMGVDTSGGSVSGGITVGTMTLANRVWTIDGTTGVVS